MPRFLLAGLALLVALSTACRRSSEPRPSPVAPEPDRVASSSPVALQQSAAPSPERAPVAAPSAASAPRLERDGRPEGTRDEAKPSLQEVKGPTPARPEATPAAAPVAKIIRGPAVGGEQYSAYLQTTGRYVPGEMASLVAIVAAKGDYKCNDKYPTRFTVSAASGLTATEPVVTGSLAGKTGSIAIPVRITSRGSASLAGELRFSVCSAERCLLEKQDLRLDFEVD
jgi:hypothetical protein